MHNKGTVIRVDGKTCIIHSQNQNYKAYIKRRIKGSKSNQLKPICVGDIVLFEIRNENEILIHEVLKRKTWLSRMASVKSRKQQVVVANVDQVLIVVSLVAPPFQPGIIDRFLIAAQKGNLDASIIINKIDLKDQEKNWAEIEHILEIYESIGYDVIQTSINNYASIEKLKVKLQDKSSVFAGHSGVGKSSLLLKIDSNLNLVTKEVSSKSLKGQHATTNVTLLPLDFGGFVVDTPGIREFGLWEIESTQVSSFFREIEEYSYGCKFKDCSHTHEPGCGVKIAVEEGDVATFRYESYCRILESLKEEEDGNYYGVRGYKRDNLHN